MKKLVGFGVLFCLLAFSACAENPASTVLTSRGRILQVLMSVNAPRIFDKHFRNENEVGGVIYTGGETFGLSFSTSRNGSDFTLVKFEPDGVESWIVANTNVLLAYRLRPDGQKDSQYRAGSNDKLGLGELWTETYVTWMHKILKSIEVSAEYSAG